MNKEDLTKAQRWEIADMLAADNLSIVDAKLDDVIPSSTWYVRYGKRVLDIAISGCALIVTLPINLVVGIITFFDVGRPIFFKQQRVGRNGDLFTVIKFRNMRNTTDENGELLPASQRVTKFGKFVRRTSIDELLNFWSVFKGDMSILGPRPLVPEYTHRYNKRHKMRLVVRPGLECPPRKLDGHVWTWQEQFDNDVWYVENLSFKTDCMMFINLVKFAFDRKSTAARAVSSRGIFMGYGTDGCVLDLDATLEKYPELCQAVVEETNA